MLLAQSGSLGRMFIKRTQGQIDGYLVDDIAAKIFGQARVIAAELISASFKFWHSLPKIVYEANHAITEFMAILNSLRELDSSRIRAEDKNVSQVVATTTNATQEITYSHSGKNDEP